MADIQSEMSLEEIGVDTLNLNFSEPWMMILGKMFANFLPDDLASNYEDTKCYNCSLERTGNVCPFKKKEIEAFKIRHFRNPMNIMPAFPTFPHGISGSLTAETSYTDRGTIRESLPVEFKVPAVSVEWVKDDTPQKTLGNFLDNITETRKFPDPVDGTLVEREISIGKLYAQEVDAEVQIDFWEYNPLSLEIITKLFRRYFVRKQNFTQCRLTSKWRNVQLRSNGHFQEEGSGAPLRRVSYKVGYVFEEIESYYNDVGSVESISNEVSNNVTNEEFTNNNL